MTASVSDLTLDTVLDTMARLSTGDAEILLAVAQSTRTELPKLVERLREAIVAQDALAVQARAHSIKGTVANCGADGLRQAALASEKLGAAGTLAEPPALLVQIEADLPALYQALDEIQAGIQDGSIA